MKPNLPTKISEKSADKDEGKKVVDLLLPKNQFCPTIIYTLIWGLVLGESL